MKDAVRLQAERFAEDLTATIRVVAPEASPFTAMSVEGSDRISVRQSPKEGVALSVAETVLLSLKAGFTCCADSRGEYLTIESSSFQVFAGGRASGEPIFRYEYLRQNSSVPAAHLHVHAHRDAFTYTMTKVGDTSRRARRRSESDAIPSVQDLHFPLGGHRFRPCLEDILEMLIDEFGVDHSADAMEELRAGRVRWRQIQLQSAIRDDPGTAAQALRSMGFSVEPARAGEPSARKDRLASR